MQALRRTIKLTEVLLVRGVPRSVSSKAFFSKVSQIQWKNSGCLTSSLTSQRFRELSTTTETVNPVQTDKSDIVVDDELDVLPPAPVIIGRQLQFFDPQVRAPRQAWVENLDDVKERKLGLVDLHPDVFADFPRTDIISENVKWQQKYKAVNYNKAPTRGELSGGGRKPWPQKGLGKARHGSIRSPLWYDGGKAHGPRGPKTYFYMLPFYQRVRGLCATLSIKLAQDDLKIVDTLDIPKDDPQFLEDLVEERKWGLSVLFVDDSDIMPKNIALSTDSIDHMNLMPVYGLNVYSMLKHETLVLTLAAVNKIEERLLYQLHRHDPLTPQRRHKASFV